MKEFIDRLRIIYKPFVLITFGFILIYTFLHWLFFLKIGLSIKEDIVKFWLPFGLPWIPVLIWLRPRIKLLHFKNTNGSFAYQFLLCLVIAIPTIIAQEYLVTYTGELTKLDNIYEISKHKKTKYYSLKKYYIEKNKGAVYQTTSVTAKHGNYYNMFVYIVMPILENETEVAKIGNKYWLGKKYNMQISNNLSNELKDRKYDEFIAKTKKEFEEANFHDFTYLEVVGNTNEYVEFVKALDKLNRISATDNIIFKANTESFDQRNGNKLFWFFCSIGIGLFINFIFLIFLKFKKNGLSKFNNRKLEKNDDLKEVLNIFIPKKGFFVTPIIINLNLLIFITMVFAGLGVVTFKASDLLNWGANFRPYTINGQWWRLLTSVFLHGGLMHVVTNMFAILFIGLFLEPLLGTKKYVFLYLISGVLASLASVWWYDAIVSVGASGAIFGLYGFFLACLLLKIFPPDIRKAFLISVLIFICFNLLVGVTGRIDNAAHIGGLITGFALGLLMSKSIKKKH